MESAKLFVTFTLLGTLMTYLQFSNRESERVTLRQIQSQQMDRSLNKNQICTPRMLHELAESANPNVRCIVAH